MWRNLFVHPGQQGIFPDLLEGGDAAERLAVAVQEYIVRRRKRRRVAAGTQGGGSHITERNQAALAALAEHLYIFILKIYVRMAQPHGLRDAQAAAVEDFEQGAVAFARPIRAVNGVHYGFHFVHGQHRRMVDVQFGHIYALRRVPGNTAFPPHPGVEAAYGAQCPGLGTGADEAVFLHIDFEIRALRFRSVPSLLREPFQEGFYIRRVGSHRVG